MSLPKIHCIFFKNLIDNCVVKFFDDFNDDFTRVGDAYVLTKQMTKFRLKKIFCEYLVDLLECHLKEFSIVNSNYYFVIAGCMPQDNILLKLCDESFPKKLQRLISAEYPLKYIIREKDIKIDLVYFNQLFDEIFNDFFSDRRIVNKYFRQHSKNLFFIRNQHVDCITLFKMIKTTFGKANCINMFDECFAEKSKNVLVAINDLTYRYIKNKERLNSDVEFKNILSEVKQYCNSCI